MTCAYAVRVALQKHPGVASVEVSLNQGLATVKLKPGNTIKPADLWETIRRGGYSNKVNRVTVRGEINSAGNQFKVAGTGEIFALEESAQVLGQAKKFAGRTVTAVGSLTPEKNLKQAVPLRLEAIQP